MIPSGALIVKRLQQPKPETFHHEMGVMRCRQTHLQQYRRQTAGQLTGGLAPVLLEMGLSATHHPHLVMEGLRLWLLQTLDDQGS